jgi:Flp pilus assembly protein TadG
MSALFSRIRPESGQALVLIAVILTGLVGMAALVVDVGSWYHADRKLQTAADAGALAGAQHLPTDQGTATTVARDYAQRNYSGIPSPAVTFPSAGEIDVRATANTPGFFARVISSAFSSVQVKAHARAAVSVPLTMKNVAPIAVKNTAACAVTNPGCYGQTVTVSFDESQVSSSTIGLINVKCYSDSSTGCDAGQTGGSELKDEIENGWPQPLPANKWYGVKTGETVGPVRQGLQDAANRAQVLFFPVFDQVGNGGRSFHIIGWAAFVIDPTGVNWGSQTRQLTGHFVTFIATDLAGGGTIDGATDFGVHVITLTQ